MPNERITEDMTDGILRRLGYYDDEEAILVEKQQSAIAAIRSALSRASKKGTGKAAGYPEFIITAPSAPDLVVVIECKAEVSRPPTSRPAVNDRLRRGEHGSSC
ncbi:hypothetical protein [Microbacterium sp. Ag1]|uniref:hypothetical protein n=1 Tax=Microbacterium sp. Ag1 TaxID=1643443 RepID=UPI0018CEBD44|nr:hypothetical protein [Microbacterium sp. Ag1]